MSQQAQAHEDVGSFYEAEITRFWEMVHQKHMHVGYWDETNPNDGLFEASKRLSEMMVHWANISEGDRFIDIGCGYGVPGIMLAKTKGCEVDGITASDYQKDEALKLVQAEGLDSKVRFTVGDANKLPFDDNTFNGAWFFESIFHMGHESALKEAYRVLKPGGSLLIADFPRLGSISEEDMKYFKEVFFVSSFLSMDEYSEVLKKSGFEMARILDVTNETMSKTWGGYLPEVMKRKEELIDRGGQEFFAMMEQLWPQTEQVVMRNLGYCIVLAKKV